MITVDPAAFFIRKNGDKPNGRAECDAWVKEYICEQIQNGAAITKIKGLGAAKGDLPPLSTIEDWEERDVVFAGKLNKARARRFNRTIEDLIDCGNTFKKEYSEDNAKALDVLNKFIGHLEKYHKDINKETHFTINNKGFILWDKHKKRR